MNPKALLPQTIQDSPQWKRYIKLFVVFVLYFTSAKGAQYLFYNFHTSPALIFPSLGIALGAMLMWGYEQWIAVALGQLFIALTSPTSPAGQLVLFMSIITYPAEVLLATYALKKFKFDGSVTRTRDALILIGVSFSFTAISPYLTTIASYVSGALQVSFSTNWTRSWAGGALSAIILVPFITSWLSKAPSHSESLYHIKRGEASAAMVVLVLITYLLFWTALPAQNSILFIYIFLAMFFWIGLRLQPRIMTLALFFATAFGIMGSIVAHPTAVPLGTQLFSDELFMILITPIFLILSSVVTERRIAVYQLKNETHELAQVMERLSSQDKFRNEFITILAHELRNPLAPIASTLEFLHLKEQDPDNLRAVISAERQVHIVRRLLDDLLDANRMTLNKFKLQVEEATLDSILQSAIDAVESFFRSRDQHFSYLLPDDTILLKVDDTRMTQAIMNLLFNAGKYSYPGSTISLTAERGPKKEIIISIKDNGMGIAPEALPLIFQPFQQAPRETPVGTGLGLGLFITRQLVEMHGGTITAESEGVNQGSTFTIKLPASIEIKKRAVAPTNVIPNLPPVSRAFNILLVDDNKAAADALQKLLILRGHSVTLAYDGKSALQAAADPELDVIILDIGLPDISGHEVAREIRKSGNGITLVALTGYGQEQDRVESRRAGFDHHLTKPIELVDIENILSSIRTSIKYPSQTKL